MPTVASAAGCPGREGRTRSAARLRRNHRPRRSRPPGTSSRGVLVTRPDSIAPAHRELCTVWRIGTWPAGVWGGVGVGVGVGVPGGGVRASELPAPYPRRPEFESRPAPGRLALQRFRAPRPTLLSSAGTRPFRRGVGEGLSYGASAGVPGAENRVPGWAGEGLPRVGVEGTGGAQSRCLLAVPGCGARAAPSSRDPALPIA